MRVVAFTGLPGTGKSTLADRLGHTTRTPVFAGDWLLGALAPHGVLTGLARETLTAVHGSLLQSLTTRQFMLNQDAIIDGILTDSDLATWQLLADIHGARLYVIECVCSDPVEHRRRIETRQRKIPGWHEVDWSHVERMRRETAELTVTRMTVDAMRPLNETLQAVHNYLDASSTTGVHHA